MTEVGEKILMKGGLEGVVKYIGSIDDKDGTWVGLELDKVKGKNDGSLNGKRYFECPNGHGIFVRYEKFKKLFEESNVKEKDRDVKENLNVENNNLEKDNSLLFQDCIIKVDDIRRENQDNVKSIIKDNCYLSKLNEYSKEVDRLKKLIKKKDLEIEDLDKKNNLEISTLRNKLQKEIKRSREISKKLNDTKKDFLNLISNFQREVLESYTEMKFLVNDLTSEVTDTTDEEHLEICATFKGMLKSFIENDQGDLKEKICKLQKLFKSKRIFN